ncbi:flagellar assembly protein FliH [Nitrosospira sp. Nsp1]|uniref:flagellar assembly protein FliH n=1 Tax=Nitrosospira sp. Nsp1 TaxID=136547 RepID=UPI000881877B|nr:flagellar assembly protein FliH [Nitrosospira sp. Nsp1]SCX56959.1 flagellar assembly protein FliH [Nitrosospira sp. Nsp1]
MASRIIHKERLAAYQRWEMDTFEPAGGSTPEPGEGKHESANNAGTAVILPTVEQIEQIHQQARQEGYAAGYEAGFNTGQEAGYQAASALGAAEVGKLQTLLHDFQRELTNADQAISDNLLTLALCLARQMLREALKVKPELMLGVVRDCLQNDAAFGQPVQLFLHPDDAALVREHLHHELNDCTVCVDSSLDRGSCRIKTGSGQIDATLATRWQRMVQTLGQNSNWLE